jgi:hypothetical protein
MPLLGHGLVVAPPPGPLADLVRHRQLAPHKPPEQAPHLGDRQGNQCLGSGGESACPLAFFVWSVRVPPEPCAARSSLHARRVLG